MKILNTAALAATPTRHLALALAEAGLAAIDTPTVVRQNVRLEGTRLCVGEQVCSLAEVERAFVVGVGKCVLAAAEALEEVLGAKLQAGIVLGVGEAPHHTLKTIRYLAGTHPMPSEQNVEATREIVALLKGLRQSDLVLVIVSGGGSTLLCLPDGIGTCRDEAAVLQALFRAGAPIQEINTVRKHLSLARGGHLAAYAYPAKVLGLIFSDVPGNDLTTIASGPTVRDESVVADAVAILSHYGISYDLPLVETPKGQVYFERVRNVLLVSNTIALQAIAAEARALGVTPCVVTDTLVGEARQVGREIVRQLHQAPPRTVRLYGGETTVVIRGHGRGGRNQELALAALEEVEAGELVLALASDGHDNSEVAGALCDTIVKGEAVRLGLTPETYLNDNNSYEFFQETQGFLMTGDTGANVSDLIMAIKS